MREHTERRIELFFMLGLALYVIAVCAVNFHSAQWYTFDMYEDGQFARIAAEGKTLFPTDWLFGNQCYVIATPVVAALFYLLFHNTVLAMSFASTLMLLLILLCFVWCCRPFCSRKSILAGVFCLAGGTLLGDSASSCVDGMQIVYTMASFYACYFLVFLIHLGVWMRLFGRKALSAGPVVLALFCSFCLGVQSAREMLVLNLPLLLISGALMLAHADAGHGSFRFALGSLAANGAGLLVNRLLPLNRAANISVAARSGGALTVWARLGESLSALAEMTGLRYWHYSWKWKPLALLAACLIALCVFCLVKGIRQGRPLRPVFLAVLLCWLSLLSVLAAGVLLIRLRAIYFFVWFLLVPLSVVELLETCSGPSARLAISVFLLCCGILNACFSFYPDLHRYREQRPWMREIVTWLDERGVDTVYGDYQAPAIAAGSGDKLQYVPLFPRADAGPDEALMEPYASPVSLALYETVDPERSVLILSDSVYDEFSGYRYLREGTSEDYQARFQERFRLEKVFSSSTLTYYVFRFEGEDLFVR